MSDSAPKKLGRFTIEEELGRGGMGVVYRARDEQLGRGVALKVMRPDLVTEEREKRFLREARSAAAIQHPNVAVVFDAGVLDARLFIAMELIDGESLRSRLDRGPLTMSEAIEITRAIVAALAEAHRANVVHRDLKPENVMLTRRGDVKILDFGLAKIYERDTSVDEDEEAATASAALTRDGVAMGTPGYMSPEQGAGRSVNHLTDIFAVGVVLYEMLVGDRPFRGDTPMEVIIATSRDMPTPLSETRPELPTSLELVVQRCIAKSPDDRFPSADALLEALERIEAPRTVAALSTVASSPRSGWWAALVGVVGLLGVGAWWYTQREAPSEKPTPAVEPEPTVAATVPPCSSGMALIASAKLQMGSAHGEVDERPVHAVPVDAFCLDVTEVTVAAYRGCVEAKTCTPPLAQGTPHYNFSRDDRDNHPVNGVSWDDATTYCRWRSARLPTEAEWELAARGEGGRTFPWGEAAADDQLCWRRENGTCSVGSRPTGATPEGIHDLAGNVLEWVADRYCPYPERSCSSASRVERGGAWSYTDEKKMRAANRIEYAPHQRNDHLGFRCAQDTASPASPRGSASPRP